MKHLIIFDLDGTLLNTIGDLAACCNQVLEQHGLPCHSIEEYNYFVGNGILRLVEQAIPEHLRSEEFVAQLRKEFVGLYTENISTYTTIYPGVGDLLRKLQHEGYSLAIASNKFQAGCEKLAKHFFPTIKFAYVLGQRPDIPLKPNPYIVREIIQRSSYTPDKILFVGDSGIDIETARAARVDSVAVTWGFRTRKELEDAGATIIVDSPVDIAKALQE